MALSGQSACLEWRETWALSVVQICIPSAQSGDRVETGGPGVQDHLRLHRELKASQAT